MTNTSISIHFQKSSAADGPLLAVQLSSKIIVQRFLIRCLMSEVLLYLTLELLKLWKIDVSYDRKVSDVQNELFMILI